jgi:hypothetical protein
MFLLYCLEVLLDVHSLNDYIQRGKEENCDTPVRKLAKKKVQLRSNKPDNSRDESQIEYVKN